MHKTMNILRAKLRKSHAEKNALTQELSEWKERYRRNRKIVNTLQEKLKTRESAGLYKGQLDRTKEVMNALQQRLKHARAKEISWMSQRGSMKDEIRQLRIEIKARAAMLETRRGDDRQEYGGKLNIATSKDARTEPSNRMIQRNESLANEGKLSPQQSYRSFTFRSKDDALPSMLDRGSGGDVHGFTSVSASAVRMARVFVREEKHKLHEKKRDNLQASDPRKNNGGDTNASDEHGALGKQTEIKNLGIQKRLRAHHTQARKAQNVHRLREAVKSKREIRSPGELDEPSHHQRPIRQTREAPASNSASWSDASMKFLFT